MAFLKKLKDRAQNLRDQILVIYYIYKHPATGFLPKLLIAFTLGYILSPVDLIPDFIPVIGYLDELIIVPVLIGISMKMVPENILEECRMKARTQPFKLKNNWIFGALFLLIWVLVMVAIIRAVIKLF